MLALITQFVILNTAGPSNCVPIAIITATTTALLAAVIFVLVQIIVCKCHPKFQQGSAGSVGEEEQAVYEQMDGVKGNVAVSDPIYMEIPT